MKRMPIFFIIIFILFASLAIYSIFSKRNEYSNIFYKCVKVDKGSDYSNEAINLLLIQIKEVNYSTAKFGDRSEYERYMKEWNETIYKAEYDKMSEKSKIDLQKISAEVYAHDEEILCIARNLIGEIK